MAWFLRLFNWCTIGIHVLRILKYDRQALALRRMQCDNVDADPIVWTNQRFIRWARSIDLGEYADNLKGMLSGSGPIEFDQPGV